MDSTRSTRPGTRLVAAALTATIATAGLGLAAYPAFADEGAETQVPSATAPSGAAVESLTTEQIAADPALAAAVAADSTVVVAAITNDAESAGLLYDAVDALRGETGLGAATRDPSLEAEAYQRAAENSLLAGNIRPDGSLFPTVDPVGRITGEIVAIAPQGQDLDADAVLAALTDEQKALLSGAAGIGIACATDAAGTTYWVVELAGSGVTEEGTFVSSGAATYRIAVASGNVAVTAAGGDVAIEVGTPQTIAIPAAVTGEIAYGAGVASFSSANVTLDGASLTWNSSDAAVATVEAGGIANGVGAGTCTISATGAAGQFIFNATVTGGDPAASIVDLSVCTIAGITPPYTADGTALEPPFTVIDANQQTVDPSLYTYAFSNNVEPGEATLTVTAVDGSPAITGTAVKTFEIIAPPVAQVAMPNVIGANAQDADATVANAGLVASTVEGEAAPDAASEGLVYATDPVAETLVNAGSTATLTYYGASVSPLGDATDLTEAGATLTVTGSAYYDGGNPVEPAISVALPDGTPLVAGTDYTAAYSNNTELSAPDAPATVTVTGIGLFSGSLSATFAVVEAPAEVTDLVEAGYTIAAINDQVFSEGAVEPTVTVNGPAALVLGTDYTVAFGNNTGPGTATVTVTGQGAYKGSLTATFEIKGDIAQAAVTGLDNQTYTGGELKPAPVVKIGTTVLTAGTDYDVAYSNNVNAGTATVTITGKGIYAGSQTVQFTITAKSIKSFQISPIASIAYSGVAQTPAVTVSDGTTALTAGTDYAVSYEQNTNAGTARVVVTGTGNYRDNIETTFVIAPVNMGSATIVMPNQVYTGGALTPKPVSVTANGLTLVEGTDYDVVGYGNNVNVGDAKVTLQGKGNFTGTAVANWKIVQQGSSNPGTTQTLPKTGDATNLVMIAVGAVVGIALVGVAVGLIVHRVRSNKRGR